MARRISKSSNASKGSEIGKGDLKGPGVTVAADRPATLRDVAAMAGVSVMTVSNVVNGRSKSVGDTTRKRVERAIGEINYRPHTSGRKLRLSQRFSIGMIFVDESPSFLADPFITQLLAGLSNHLSDRGYGLMVQGIAPARIKDALVVRNEEADAICIMLSGDLGLRRQALVSLQELRQPIILFQERTRAGPNVCSIRQQDRLGASQLAAHLLNRGARKIVFLATAASWPAIDERLRGARDALRGAGAATLVRLDCGQGDLLDTKAAIRSHVDAQGVPDAIMGGNDQMGIAALKWAKEHDIAVPDNLLVTGFNGFDFREYTDPVLTSVQSSAYEMGQRGASVILDRLNQGVFHQRDIIFPVKFLLGESA